LRCALGGHKARMGDDAPLEQGDLAAAVRNAAASGDERLIKNAFWAWWVGNDLDEACFRYLPAPARRPSMIEVQRDTIVIVAHYAINYVKNHGHVPTYGLLANMVRNRVNDAYKSNIKQDPFALKDQFERGFAENPDDKREREEGGDANEPIGSDRSAFDYDNPPVDDDGFDASALITDLRALAKDLSMRAPVDDRRAARLLEWKIVEPDIKTAEVARAEGWSEQNGKNAAVALAKAIAERFPDGRRM
jgi:hypothetical protein